MELSTGHNLWLEHATEKTFWIGHELWIMKPEGESHVDHAVYIIEKVFASSSHLIITVILESRWGTRGNCAQVQIISNQFSPFMCLLKTNDTMDNPCSVDCLE